MTIGAIDARSPRPERPPTAPELEKRLQALKDQRAGLDDQIGAETARKQFAERFATEHKTDLPFVYDPQGKFAAEVNSDRDMGNRIGIHQTPTIYVVSSKGQPYTEVSDLGSLFKTIDAVKNR